MGTSEAERRRSEEVLRRWLHSGAQSYTYLHRWQLSELSPGRVRLDIGLVVCHDRASRGISSFHRPPQIFRFDFLDLQRQLTIHLLPPPNHAEVSLSWYRPCCLWQTGEADTRPHRPHGPDALSPQAQPRHFGQGVAPTGERLKEEGGLGRGTLHTRRAPGLRV